MMKRTYISEATLSAHAAALTVLIVEDQPELQELLCELFVGEGYRVAVAADGEVAVHLARTIRPDLMILDLMLPRKSGHEVLGELAADVSTYAIPVVVVSADTCSLVRTPQVRAVLGKPFDLWRLLDLAHQLTERQDRAA